MVEPTLEDMYREVERHIQNNWLGGCLGFKYEEIDGTDTIVPTGSLESTIKLLFKSNIGVDAIKSGRDIIIIEFIENDPRLRHRKVVELRSILVSFFNRYR